MEKTSCRLRKQPPLCVAMSEKAGVVIDHCVRPMHEMHCIASSHSSDQLNKEEVKM